VSSILTAGLKDMDDFDLDMGESEDEEENTTSTGNNAGLYQKTVDFCGGADLVQIFGPTGSGKTEFIVSVVEDAVSNTDNDILFIDTERNLSDNERVSDVDYVYVPDWDDIYAYVSGKSTMLNQNSFGENSTGSKSLEDGYDIVVLDSIGLPALMKYDEYSIEDDADQFKVFQMFQYVSGLLKRYAQRNDALVLVTNQPGSELASDGGDSPFGDKSQFAYKEMWKTQQESSSEFSTTCYVNAFRSRQAGKGKKLFKLEISDNGTEVTRVDSEQESNEWT